jgi:hypothetical protein
MQRRRSNAHSFEDKIAAKKARALAQMASESGPEREALAKRIRQLDTASRMTEWLPRRASSRPSNPLAAS